MAKPGPKTPWFERVRYLRSKCTKRLKSNQTDNLAASNAFASWSGNPLNGYLTIKFSEIAPPLAAFRKGVKALSKWHREQGLELTWIYVWEAKGGFHVHALLHVAPQLSAAFNLACKQAFSGHNVLLKRRTPGPDAMAYICKGTDYITHAKLKGASTIWCKNQGLITWARCGVTENINKSARQKAGFAAIYSQSNCVKTCSKPLNKCAPPKPQAHGGNQGKIKSLSLVVLCASNNTPFKPQDQGASLGVKPNQTPPPS